MEGINTTLSRGSMGDQVKALQRYLIGLGYQGVKADGVYGPITESAVKQFQLDNGLKGDGIFGPKSRQQAVVMGSSSAPSALPGTGKAPDDPSFMFNTETGELNTKFVPKTQKELDTFYNASALSHSVFAGNSPEALEYAASTGDFNALMDDQGKPFSTKIQKEAMSQAEEALRPGFEAEKRFDIAKTEDELRGEAEGFRDFLEAEKLGFESDKTSLDQGAAEQGVLFSGARIEREKALKNAYEMNQDAERRRVASSIGSIARGNEYAYGRDAARSPSLSQYYQLGGNMFNPKVARGGVTSSPLSSVYGNNAYDFQGTKVVANKANQNIRAANLLKNRGNKLMASGFKNQF